jgi:hypothetical protein
MLEFHRIGLRLGILGTLALVSPLPPSPAEELTAPLCRAQLLGQLIAARIATELILGLIGRPGLRQDPTRDLVELNVRLRARVARQPRAVDRHHPRPDQPRSVTQPQHPSEQVSQRPLVPLDEPRDRRAIGDQVAGDHPLGHVPTTATLDRARAALPGRIRIQQQRHHHRRLTRRATMTTSAIRGVGVVLPACGALEIAGPAETIRDQPVVKWLTTGASSGPM